ncbi:MAG: HAD family hydrolase [Myxococcales bacterium]|nr:HAD family hydrolase [Myxococcales bacterium]
MTIAAVVLDFDGTFTEVSAEAIPFVDAYRKGLEGHVGRPLDEMWRAAEALVDADPQAHGWRYDGRIVAPAHADPYIRTSTVAHLVLDRLGIWPDAEERTQRLAALFREAYANSDVVFRPEARAVLEAIRATGVPVRIVTNSDTAAVRAKLARLLPDAVDAIEVHGGARKYVLGAPTAPSPLFDALPERIDPPGLARPVWVRRGHYFDVLRSIWQAVGAGPEALFVCGDILELDLALPAMLGAHVHLVARPETAEWERSWIERAPRGGLGTDLGSILRRLRALGLDVH